MTVQSDQDDSRGRGGTQWRSELQLIILCNSSPNMSPGSHTAPTLNCAGRDAKVLKCYI